MNQIHEFVKHDNYHFVIVGMLDGSTYGFNMKIEAEYDIVQDIVDSWTYTALHDQISGWKVSKELTSQVKNADAWKQFVKGCDQEVLHDSTSYSVEDKEEQENENDDGEELYEKKRI